MSQQRISYQTNLRYHDSYRLVAVPHSGAFSATARVRSVCILTGILSAFNLYATTHPTVEQRILASGLVARITFRMKLFAQQCSLMAPRGKLLGAIDRIYSTQRSLICRRS